MMGAVQTKSPEAFRTIGEVAEELAIPQHVLRFWEAKFAHIRPVKRGGGRRYYRPEDVELLRSIRHLLHDNGYTIKGVQKLLRENGPGVLRHSVDVMLVPDDGEVAPRQSSRALQKANGDGDWPATGGGAAGTDNDLAAIVRELEMLRRRLIVQ